jgi:hypothetical protein
MLKHNEKISEIEREIGRLMLQRSKLLKEAEVIRSVYSRGQMLSDMLYKASTFKDTEHALDYTKQYIIPMRDHLMPSHFSHAIHALLEPLPKRWTRIEASDFFITVSRALERDRVALMK